MDAYEATKIVFSRIQSIDPENAAKIMGLLLIQDHGEKELIRLAFGPESLLQSVVQNARKDLGFLPPSSSCAASPPLPAPPAPTANPFVLPGQNSASRLLVRPPPLVVSSPSSWASSSPFSRSGDEIHSGGDELIDEIHLHDQLSFLNDPVASGGDELFSYGMGWGSPVSNGGNQRRSCSISDICFGSDPTGLGWKPCLYFARGYCKNGSSCRFLHGLADEAKMDAALEQEFLLRSKSQRFLASAASAFPYSPTGTSLPQSPSGMGKCMSFLLQQHQQNESQRAAVAAAAAAALMLGGDDPHKFMGRPRMERSDFSGMMNPSSRQIYLTFPADSTFREEDVSNYFSIYGPVQDVRIPYQQKRMFGFVTFVYPETVKLILAKGNPHFVCDARVLVKPYKEKGKVPDKYRKQVDRGDFSGCNTPSSLDSRDQFDLQQLGSRMLYAGNNQDSMLRRKLEEQQELQQAIELQQRRFMGLQLLDLKRNSTISTSAVAVSPPSPFPLTNVLTTAPSEGDKSLRPGSCTAIAVSRSDQDDTVTKASPKEDGDFQESCVEHNLPDSPFASPKKSAFAANDSSTISEAEPAAAASASSALLASTLRPATSTLESMAPFKSCFFQMPRFSSGPGAVGL
ncbi:zinc finger CCCH domain-containing protein 53-like [Phalaenopsis equestris]|uniref:zinc finger CCCH domain-containing protein 53-like n=1 Tax=Phalaenopsis equestris TaxID=78828 RepID=UPI0009E30465|nr:zinc finger CCCH domain-containing protein 53-like [Phalaenopsis equestris]XP_020581560.1 zinc finger CCCH domain-containing protein 53-like [Phalaenopsis equestris]